MFFVLSSKSTLKLAHVQKISVRVEEPVKRVACCLSLRVRRVVFYFLPASGMKKLCLGWRTRHDELYSNKLRIVRLMVFALAAVSPLHPKVVWSEFFKPERFLERPGIAAAD